MASAKKHQPTVRKGVVFPFQVSAVCWVDLLGYGGMLAEAGFNPLHGKAIDAMGRLLAFHKIVASKGNRYFPTLVLNDAAVSHRDLSLRSRSVTFDFLCRCWTLFGAIREAEQKAGFPGARMVVATGFRIRAKRTSPDPPTGHLGSILKRFDAGIVGAKQAISEAVRARQSFGLVPELQTNFAFTKAYVADQSGTKGGLKGARCFVDLALFKKVPSSWLESDEPVIWKHDHLGLSANFLPVRALRTNKYPEGGPLEVRDALEVAQYLTHDANVLKALRSATLRSV
jgi:hypothetical protein